jgi:hypothetical protein
VATSKKSEGLDDLIFSTDFLKLFGAFHAIWAKTDSTVDCLIGKILKINSHQTHIITSGLEFGRKARLLIELLKVSDHKNKSKLIGFLNKLRNVPKRNVFAHSYILSSRDFVTFIERSGGSDYVVKSHKYTLKEFLEHVHRFAELNLNFGLAANISEREHQEFLIALFRAIKS